MRTVSEKLLHLRLPQNPENVPDMARFGIRPSFALGIPMPELRKLARQIGKNHGIAQGLWKSGIHEAKMLACLTGDPLSVTEGEMEPWLLDFDTGNVCDHYCGNLFGKTPLAYRKAQEWSRREEEFVKRAAFSLVAALTVQDKQAGKAKFPQFLPTILRECSDSRKCVKKSVYWALLQMGKRNRELNIAAIQIAKNILKQNSPAARWISTNALQELENPKLQQKLQKSAENELP